MVVRAGRGATQLDQIALHNLLQSQPEWTQISAMQRDEDFSVRKQARELEGKVQGRLVDEADVVCATCLSSAGFDLHQGSSGRGFTHVLMDEAAQASEVSALVPIAQGCEKLVLVGDQSQLVSPNPSA